MEDRQAEFRGFLTAKLESIDSRLERLERQAAERQNTIDHRLARIEGNGRRGVNPIWTIAGIAMTTSGVMALIVLELVKRG